jgi:Nucleoside-diphosphate-sugar epimerases
MRVVVTGGNGFLGRHVVRALEREGYDIHAPKSGEYDLRDKDACERLMCENGPVDAVVHLAAKVGGIGENVSAPGTFLYENAMMGLQLMEAARRCGVQKFLTVGTACMYPDTVPVPTTESQLWNGFPAQETNAYAQAKRLILAQGLAYAEQYDFNAVFVIPSNLYGPGDESTHVVPMLTKKFFEAQDEGENVLLWGSGSATRDFLYVEDAARGIVTALMYYNEPHPVNLGTGMETPIWALAQAIAYETGFEGRIQWDPTKPEGTMRRALDCTRALYKFGWTADTKLNVGLPQYLEWYEGMRDE